MKSVHFSGVFTALVTPFYKQKIDFASLKKLVHQQIRGGVSGFVINGTTAESPTLTESEVEKLFKFIKNICQKEAPKNFKLILGTGSNSTAETIKKTKKALSLKADAALVVVPYYNKPSQEGLYQHFSAVARATPRLPIILYNVPGRTITALAPETLIRLAEIKNITGIKEASGDLSYIAGTQKTIADRYDKNFSWLSGDDGTAPDFILKGGHGVISVVSHVIPQQFSLICARARGGDYPFGANATLGVEMSREDFQSLCDVLFIESNPVPVKRALFEMNILKSDEVRLPLVKMSEDNKKVLHGVLLQQKRLKG